MSLLLIVVAAVMIIEAIRRFRNNDWAGGIAFVILAIMDMAVVFSLLENV